MEKITGSCATDGILNYNCYSMLIEKGFLPWNSFPKKMSITVKMNCNFEYVGYCDPLHPSQLVFF